jgi:hypothetical protein
MVTSPAILAFTWEIMGFYSHSTASRSLPPSEKITAKYSLFHVGSGGF